MILLLNIYNLNTYYDTTVKLKGSEINLNLLKNRQINLEDRKISNSHI